MPNLNFRSVHQIDGDGNLVGFDPYRMFEAALGKDGRPLTEEDVALCREKHRPVYTTKYFTQGGHWYGNDLKPIDVDAVPDWVWIDCKAMSPLDRAAYRIVLPEDAAQGFSIPKSDEAEDYPSHGAIWAALMSLENDHPENWDADDRPRLDTLSGRLGCRVTRKRLAAVAPSFRRRQS